jgi:hypothetical protein
MVACMTAHRIKLLTMWGVAAGFAVAGGTSAVALADNHGVTPKPLSQHQVAKQLAAVKAAPNAKPSKPSTKPSAGGDTKVVTTRGGSEEVFCSNGEVNVGSVSQAVGWRVAIFVPDPGEPNQKTYFVNYDGDRSSVEVTTHCEAGQPTWTITDA